MKITLLILLVFCAAAAFGQTASVLPSQAQMVVVPDHPQHAEQHELAAERPLVGGSANAYTYAQGERPLWEFGPSFPPATPLGDVARAYRKEKITLKKAERVLDKQGS
jgi:hypothetical protein